ncbi:MAG TPA: MtrB/PioB family outer membrane beta-barrel protein [Vicinamibacterales bacterium]|nr:MtrB/PioB family outer membrane beta-barrel protein [Vicinamibacterales bacterium]
MRTRTMLIGALLLGSAGLARAQDPQQQVNGAAAQQIATPAASFQPTLGQVDFGFRADSTKGDAARYYRFKDWREGAFLDAFKFEKETEVNLFRAEANNVGYRDQRYFAGFESIGRLKAVFEWNQVPLYMTDVARSLYTDQGNGVLSIDDSVQAALQVASGLGTAVRDRAISAALADTSQFDMRSRRDVAMFDLVYAVNRDVDVIFRVNNANRVGSQVFSFGFGTSPGLNPSMEMAAPLDDRTTDFEGKVEYANRKGLLAVGYNGSWYNNSIATIRFDNPLRAVDAVNGPSVGQAAWWPTSTAFSVNVNGAYNLARRTRATAAISFGQWSQDEEIVPPTVNTALVSPPLERATAETEADIVSMVYTLNSRPADTLWLNARYRYYDYDNQTPHFTVENAIIGDWSQGTQIHETEPASFKRQNLDLDASFTPYDYVALGVGYGRETGDRTFRIFGRTEDNTFRVTADSTGNQYFGVRFKYEYSTREGSEFDPHLLEEVGEQPDTRHFDIADRDRDRTSVILTVTPVGYLSFNGAVGYGHDDYTDTGFGLRDNDNKNWSAGFDVTPIDTVSFGFSYGYERLTALQYSRNTSSDPASAAGQAQFNDPRRDWSIDQTDTVKTILASVDVIKAFPKTDIRVSFDQSDGDATYVYNLATPFLTPAVQQLVPLKNQLTGFRGDVRYFVRPNLALGVRYDYEKYKVDDFSLDTGAINRLDPVNASNNTFASTIYTNYLFRPYTGHTAWLRMTYLW